MRRIAYAICALLAACGGTALAQPSDAWLMKNYHFTGPPPPGSIRPADPVVTELRHIQNTVLSIMRKTDFARDYEGALAAAAQAAANAQLIGTINERLESAAAANPAPPAPVGPVYYIALKDHSIDSATAYWTDELMLHYLTPQGAHVQVRLNLVDRGLSNRINKMRSVEFRLPE